MHQIHFVIAAIEHQALPNSSANLAIFAAIRRASSLGSYKFFSVLSLVAGKHQMHR
jgi:hypothetical protein